MRRTFSFQTTWWSEGGGAETEDSQWPSSTRDETETGAGTRRSKIRIVGGTVNTDLNVYVNVSRHLIG